MISQRDPSAVSIMIMMMMVMLMMMMVVVGSAQKPGQSIILQLLLCPMLLFTQGGFGYTVYLE